MSDLDDEGRVLTIAVHLKGLIPSLMHSAALKDPFNRYTRVIKKHSAKAKKTDQDHKAMMEAEFRGSLYCRDDKKGGPIYWPADNIHACIRTGAKFRKLGKKVDEAVSVHLDTEFNYPGPKSRDALWKNQNFRYIKAVGRGVMSCRPIFRDWEVKFTLDLFPELLNFDDLYRSLRDAGRYIGLTDWPRKFGHFAVESIEEVNGV